MKKYVFMLCVFMFLSQGCMFNETDEYLQDLKSENIAKKNIAISYFSSKLSDHAVPALIAIVRSTSNNETKRNAIEALGNIGDQKALDCLIGCLADKDSKIKLAAIESLGKIKNAKAVTHITTFLDDEDFQLVAIWALGNIGDKKAIPPLEALFKIDDKLIKYNAYMALSEIQN